MKIYTKTGDKGETSLIGGTRVQKHHIKIEAYGTVDELNSYLGLLRDLFDHTHTKNILSGIQNDLFVIGSHLAEDHEKSKMKLPEINDASVELMEKEIDLMNEILPELKFFILPGGNPIASHAHIARCVCRRAERCITSLMEIETTNEILLRYINRLSDYLFTLARFIVHINKGTEVPWQVR